MSNRIAVMSEGRMLQIGDSAAIYERPTSRFVADFIGDINLIPAQLVAPTEVRLAGLVSVAIAGDRPSKGAWLALRPEQLHLATEGDHIPNGMNVIEGTVSVRVYYGDSYYYDVVTEVGGIDVRQENRPGLDLHEPGTRLKVWWNPKASSMVTD